MRFRATLSRQRLLAVLMLASAAGTMAGPAVWRPLRNLAGLALPPVGDGLIYLATALANQRDLAGRPSFSQDEAHRKAEENKLLRLQRDALVRKLHATKRRIADIQNIRTRLYGPRRDLPVELIPARIVARDPLPYTATGVVNVGSRRGADAGDLVTVRRVLTDRSKVLPGQFAVITASALVGRLTETHAFTGRLQLITDPGFRIPVVVRRLVDPAKPRRITVESPGRPSEVLLTPTNAEVKVGSPAKGDGRFGMVIRQVKALHGIQAGDQVLTRDGMVGAPIPIGVVQSVQPDPDKPGVFVTLHVQPQVSLATVQQVYIVVPPGPGSVPSRPEGKR